MRTRLAAFIVLATLHYASALPNFDPFAGAAGSLIDQSDSSGNVWQGVGTQFAGAQPLVVSNGLSYANLPAATGNSVAFEPSSGQAARVSLNLAARLTNAPLYYSLLLKITDLSAVPTTAADNFICTFSDTTAAQTQGLSRASSRLVAKRTGAGYQLGIGLNSTEFAYATNVFNLNDVVFVVASWTYTGTRTNANLWVNPAAASFGASTPPAPSAGVTNGTTGGALNASGPRAFLVSCLNATAPGGILDELRVHTNWSYVTGGDPAILTPPSSQTLPPGENAAFTVRARGTPTLSYRWIKDGTTVLTNGGNVIGATTSNLTLTTISTGDAGSYTVVVTNGVGNSITSSPAVLTVTSLDFLAQPQSRTDDYGATATFTVTPAGAPPFTYQWQKNGAELTNGGNVSGVTTNTLTLTSVSWLDAAGYSVVVSRGPGNSVTSAVATLAVRDPAITQQPASRTNVVGTPATFSVAAAGTPTVTCQWRRENTNLVDGANISGSTSNTLTLASVAPGDRASYSVVLSGTSSGLSVTSSPAFLTVRLPQGSTPNFIVIITDDQRWDSMGVVQREMGAAGRFPWFTNGTPNMDRLAAEGVRFRNAFVALSLCSPSRAAILTGRYNHLNGIINNSTAFPPSTPTYASRLRDAGYVTGMVGKWHMGSQVARPGFDFSASFIGQGNYNDTTFYVNGVATPSTGWVDDISTDYALAFINSNYTNAFALQLGYKSTHGPNTPPTWAANLYDTSVSRDVPNLSIPPPYRTNIAVNSETSKRTYHRCLTAADADIGRILDRLDQLGLTTNTMVIFLGDNGYYLGEHGLGDKRSLYEESLRIPMLVRYPRLITQPAARDELVLNIDIAPTILDLAGVAAPSDIQGRSWRPWLAGGAATGWRQSFLAEYILESGYAIPTTVILRTTGAKLTFWPGNPAWCEMFDLTNDRYEVSNLFNVPAYQPMRDSLRAEFDRQMRETGLGAELTALRWTNGVFSLGVTGGMGPNYQLEASSNFQAWTSLSLLKMTSTQGATTVSNAVAPPSFYRLRWISD
jgi:arylsulfatase A-like enzyme